MNLLMFLSDRCNMACDYCFLDLNHGASMVLAIEAARRAIDEHAYRFGRRARFTILGGEPFVHYPRLRAVVEHIHAQAPQAPLTVVTNGTLACPKKFSELFALGAGVTVSLDGAASIHDLHRKLVGAPDASSAAETLKAMEACDKSQVRVNMVVCQDSAGCLVSSVEALRALGFRDLSFHLNILENWNDAGLETLSKALAGFKRYYRAVDFAVPNALRLSHLESFAVVPLEHDYDDLVLGADARYYPCDGLFARPYAELGRWAVGDAQTGVDWRRRKYWHRSALEFVHARLKRPGHYSCGREVYFHALATGRDPDRAVQTFQRADEIIGEALQPMMVS